MSAGAQPSSRWLYGPIPDLFLGAGLAYAVVFLLLAVAGPQIRWLAPIGLLPLVSLFTGSPHYGATLLRVYEHREDRNRYALFAVWISLVVWGVFVVGVYSVAVGSLFLTLYLTWSPWHYSGQNYGIALMFLARRGVRVTPQAKRMLYLSFIFSFALTVLAIHGEDPATTYAPVPFDGVAYQFRSLGIPTSLTLGLLLLCVPAYLFTVVATGVLLRREGSWRDLAPALVLMGTQALWFSVPVICRASGILGGIEPLSVQYAAYSFLWIGFAHSVQYLWVTSHYVRRTERYPGHRRYVVKTVLAGQAIWGIPALLFMPALLGTHPLDAGFSVLIASAVNLHHFMLDGAIWKLRDGRIAQVLLRTTPTEQVVEPTAGRRPWLKYTLFALGGVSVLLAIVGTLEIEITSRNAYEEEDLPRLEAASRHLRWMGRDHPEVHLLVADLAARRGELEKARMEAETSLALSPSPAAWIALGKIHQHEERLEDAIASYDSALELEASNADALHGKGRVLLQQGEVVEARKLLSRAVAAAPERAELRRSLKAAMKSGSSPPARSRVIPPGEGSSATPAP